MKYMTIPCHYKYEEKYLPPRCRKYRYREAMATHPIQIPIITPDEAPIAFKHAAHIVGVTPEDSERYYGSYRTYRAYNGKLYLRIPASAKDLVATGWWTLTGLKKEISVRQTWSPVHEWDKGYLHDITQCEAHFDAMFARYLIIESGGKKQIWAETPEPMYCINTFGLGHNHGGIGTSFGITNHYNPNIGNDRYFNALQGKACQQKALEIAKNRGDTDSIPYIRRTHFIKVLMPEMVTRDPQKEHGDGDPFTNSMEDLISGSSSATEAGLLVMTMTRAMASQN